MKVERGRPPKRGLALRAFEMEAAMRCPRSARRWLTLAFASLAVLDPTLTHADAAKNFPDFRARKASLGSITLLIDSHSIINVHGKIEHAKLDQGLDAAKVVEDALLGALRARGYAVDTIAFVSAGAGVRSDWEFTAAGDSTAGPPADSAGVFHAPFWMDSTRLGRPEARDAWDRMIQHVNVYKKRPRDSAGFFPEPTILREAVGGDVLAAVTVHFYGVSQKEKFDRAPGLGLLRGLAGKLYAEEALDQSLSSSRICLMLTDARSGEVLWFDERFGGGGYDAGRTRKLASQIVEDLP
jgi:hypothetical protein